MMRAQTRHPLDPLSAAEIAVAVATVRSAGKTPEVSYRIGFMYGEYTSIHSLINLFDFISGA